MKEIDWFAIEEAVATASVRLPDCVPSNAREWSRFIEQYDNAMKYVAGEGVDFTFEDMTHDQHWSLVNEHLCLGYGMKKSVFECCRDLSIKQKSLFDGLDWWALEIVERSWVWRNVSLNGMQMSCLPQCPKYVVGFRCSDIYKLENLKGAPEHVSGDFTCVNSWLKSLEGAPRYVGGHFICSDNPLESLEGAPEYVGKDFVCNDTKIKSLKGAPKNVFGYFVCGRTSLPGGVPEAFPGSEIDRYREENSVMEFSQFRKTLNR